MSLSRSEQRRLYEPDFHFHVIDEDIDSIIKVQQAQLEQAERANRQRMWAIGLLATFDIAIITAMISAILASR